MIVTKGKTFLTEIEAQKFADETTKKPNVVRVWVHKIFDSRNFRKENHSTTFQRILIGFQVVYDEKID